VRVRVRVEPSFTRRGAALESSGVECLPRFFFLSRLVASGGGSVCAVLQGATVRQQGSRAVFTSFSSTPRITWQGHACRADLYLVPITTLNNVVARVALVLLGLLEAGVCRIGRLWHCCGQLIPKFLCALTCYTVNAL
ncbi:unnamed protein product, partial [Discosporangium mesarthrocarpum]